MNSKSVKKVGVIGGGQLAKMMADALSVLDLDLVIQTPYPDDPAVAIASHTILAPINDTIATAHLASICDVITFENEFVDLVGLQSLADQGVCFRPSLSSMTPLLDKFDQYSYLRNLNLPVPNFYLASDYPLQFPLVIKTRRLGYDGQGTFIIKDESSLSRKLSDLASVEFLIQEYIPFDRELAVIAARDIYGQVVTYPVVQTIQQNQICHQVLIGTNINPELVEEIASYAHTILNALDLVGVIGMELFLTDDQKIFINEISPRTHNSGHYTLDLTYPSQFEQQLRVVAGLEVKAPVLRYPSGVMVNLLGYETANDQYLAQRHALAQLPQTFVHWYGKNQSRPGRKLGHVTVLLDELNEEIVNNILSIWNCAKL